MFSYMAKTDLSRFGDALWSAIENWDIEVDKQLIDSIEEVSIETKDFIKKYTPRRRGGNHKHIRNCYKVTRINRKNGYERILHNEKYQLAHLLEDGHKVYTRKGKRTDPKAEKVGPLPVKRIWAKYKYHIPQKPDYTSKYNMWNKGKTYAENKLYADLVERLESIGKYRRN